MKFKKTISILPDKIRKYIVRKMIPGINIDTDIDVSVAYGKDKVDCIKLLNETYIDAGYITREEATFDRVPQHALETTKVFAVKNKGKIIATFTIFQDSKYGLPIDIGFKEHIDFLRGSMRKVVEIGCLATDRRYRKGNMSIPFLINRSSVLYSMNVLGADDLVITTHPKFKIIYEDILLAKKLGEIKHFDYVDGNPAVAFWSNLKTLDSDLKRVYCNFPDEKNIHKIIFGDLGA